MIIQKGTYARVMALYHATGPAINKAGRERESKREREGLRETERNKAK